MLRFNTSFLLLATAVTALGCLPMALNRESGFVWTAFLLPMSLACLAATQVRERGPFEFRFRELPNSVVEIGAEGGRFGQWVTRSRIVVAGFSLSIVIGFPMLNLVDPEPLAMWLPVVGLFAVGALLFVGSSARRSVLTEERQLVTERLLFGRFCWRRMRWQMREGDFMEIVASGQARSTGVPDLQFFHTLRVGRARRRQAIASLFANERIVPEMEAAARRVAEMVGIPYEGYRESFGCGQAGHSHRRLFAGLRR